MEDESFSSDNEILHKKEMMAYGTPLDLSQFAKDKHYIVSYEYYYNDHLGEHYFTEKEILTMPGRDIYIVIINKLKPEYVRLQVEYGSLLSEEYIIDKDSTFEDYNETSNLSEDIIEYYLDSEYTQVIDLNYIFDKDKVIYAKMIKKSLALLDQRSYILDSFDNSNILNLVAKKMYERDYDWATEIESGNASYVGDFTNLTRLTLKFVPLLANGYPYVETSGDVSLDHSSDTWYFKINPGTYAENGTQIDANLYVSSIKKYIKIGQGNYYNLDKIMNYDDYLNGQSDLLGIEAIDDFTVKFNFTQQLRGHDIITIANIPVYVGDINNNIENFISYGDYIAKANGYLSNDYGYSIPYFTYMLKNQENSPLAFREINVYMVDNLYSDEHRYLLRTGVLDYHLGSYQNIQYNLEKNERFIIKGNQDYYLQFNTLESSSGYLHDENLRKAISYYLDREALSQISGFNLIPTITATFNDKSFINSDEFKDILDTFDLTNWATANIEKGDFYLDKVLTENNISYIKIDLNYVQNQSVYQRLLQIKNQIEINSNNKIIINLIGFERQDYDYYAEGLTFMAWTGITLDIIMSNLGISLFQNLYGIGYSPYYYIDGNLHKMEYATDIQNIKMYEIVEFYELFGLDNLQEADLTLYNNIKENQGNLVMSLEDFVILYNKSIFINNSENQNKILNDLYSIIELSYYRYFEYMPIVPVASNGLELIVSKDIIVHNYSTGSTNSVINLKYVSIKS